MFMSPALARRRTSSLSLHDALPIFSDARAEDVQEGEALVQDTLLDQLRQVLLFTAETAGDEGGACGQRQGNGIDRCLDRKSTRLNSSHRCISYAVFCLKKTYNWTST